MFETDNSIIISIRPTPSLLVNGGASRLMLTAYLLCAVRLGQSRHHFLGRDEPVVALRRKSRTGRGTDGTSR